MSAVPAYQSRRYAPKSVAHAGYLDSLEGELQALKASPDYGLARAMAEAYLARQLRIEGLRFDDARHEQSCLDCALLAAKDAIAVARAMRQWGRAA